jgi:Phage tail protein
MPILAFPVASGPTDPTVIGDLTDSRSIGFESLTGQPVLDATNQAFIFLSGIEGLGIPPRDIALRKTPGMDGARIQEVKTLEREIFLPVFVEDWTGHAAYLDAVDQLASQMNYRTADYRSNDGTLNLVATSVKGMRRLRCLYQGGMDTGYGTDNEGNVWASLGLKFLCVQPYWYGTPWSTPVLKQDASPPDFFASFPGALSNDLILGSDIPITVDGDVDSWITIELVGPATSVTISGDGLLVSIPAGISDGSTVKIVTDPRGRTALFDGQKNWARIGPTTTWAPFPPGDRQISIVMAGVDVNSQAVVYGSTLYERPW